MRMRIAAIAAVLVIGFFAYMILTPILYRGKPPAKVNVCRSNTRWLSNCLYFYAIEEGRFPDSGKWVQVLEQYYARTPESKWILESLKCPSDETSSSCSYEMNAALSERRLTDFPEEDRKHIVMLREKAFSGSHHWVIYLDKCPEHKALATSSAAAGTTR